jgi:hypothetical protein
MTKTTIFLAVLGVCLPAWGQIIYVDVRAAGANDGSSWADAYNHIQDALADASAADKPVEIRVAQGLYKPDHGAAVTLGSQGASFELLNGVALRGGFAGFGAINADARDFVAYETILTGDLSGDDAEIADPEDFEDEPTRAENSGRVLKARDTDGTALLDGFTITKGHEGLHQQSGTVTVSNCTFKSNSRDGIHTFRGDMTLINCIFEGNFWGVHNYGDNLTLIGCLFENNRGPSGAGVFSHGDNVTLLDCKFIGNVTAGAGGAVDCHADNLTIRNCVFTSNAAREGGAVKAWADRDDRVIVENCTFTGNRGGAIRQVTGRLIVSNCVFAGNVQNDGQGGAISTWGEYTSIRNCTFSDNSASDSGGAIYLPREGRISNSIFSGNSAPSIEGRFDELSVEYCTVEGGWPGEGNIDADPCFVRCGYWDDNGTEQNPHDDFWVDGDYHLRSQAGRPDPETGDWIADDVTSPCIDAGDPNSPIGTEPFPNGGRMNMGAYGAGGEAAKSYFGRPPCEVILAGDINGDCVVDFDDLAIVVSHWAMRGEDFVNKTPTVSVIAPEEGARIARPGPTLLRAQAHDVNGDVESVRFFVQQKLEDRTISTKPYGREGTYGWEYELTWDSTMPAGDWTVWAEAMDTEGLVGVSPEIVITLYNP